MLLLHEIDDLLVPAVHAARYQAAQPTTRVVELEPGDLADPSTKFRHGTVSAGGRAHYASAVGAFADQAIVRKGAEQVAAGISCAGVTDHLTDVGVRRVQRELRCLARHDAALEGTAAGTWQRTTVNVRGEVGAARIWARMRATVAGRRSLAALAARHARLSVQLGARSRVSLRCTKR